MNFLITGASRGIGLELAQFALETEHNVMVIVRDPNNARNLAAAKKQYLDTLTILKGDVTQAADLLALSQTIGDQAIDVLINNAGVMVDGDEGFSGLTLEDLENTFAVNTFAPVAVAQTFLSNLKKSKSAKLINITSQMGSIADNTSGGYYAYRMSKAALNMFAKSFAIDHPGIVTLNLHPGWVKTDMGGAQAPTLPRESARGLFKVISEAAKSQSGHFYDFKGKELPW